MSTFQEEGAEIRIIRDIPPDGLKQGDIGKCLVKPLYVGGRVYEIEVRGKKALLTLKDFEFTSSLYKEQKAYWTAIQESQNKRMAAERAVECESATKHVYTAFDVVVVLSGKRSVAIRFKYNVDKDKGRVDYTDTECFYETNTSLAKAWVDLVVRYQVPYYTKDRRNGERRFALRGDIFDD